MKIIMLFSTFLIFGACSNVEVGFDEDSIFHNNPESISKKSNTNNEKVEETTVIQEKENETTVSYSPEYSYE